MWIFICLWSIFTVLKNAHVRFFFFVKNGGFKSTLSNVQNFITSLWYYKNLQNYNSYINHSQSSLISLCNKKHVFKLVWFLGFLDVELLLQVTELTSYFNKNKQLLNSVSRSKWATLWWRSRHIEMNHNFFPDKMNVQFNLLLK